MAPPPSEDQPKPVRGVRSSKADLSGGRTATGGRSPLGSPDRSEAAFAKPLRGFRDAGVLEIVDDFDGDTFRAVYTVRFAKAVYVLHAFQKKSRRGIATPRPSWG